MVSGMRYFVVTHGNNNRLAMYVIIINLLFQLALISFLLFQLLTSSRK